MQFAQGDARVAVNFRQRGDAVQRSRDEVDVLAILNALLSGDVGPAAFEARCAEKAPAAFLDYRDIAAER